MDKEKSLFASNIFLISHLVNIKRLQVSDNGLFSFVPKHYKCAGVANIFLAKITVANIEIKKIIK
jgi:hypothetical protein